MVDPHAALISYQDALLNGYIQPQQCELFRDMTILIDEINGKQRLTYALVDGLKVKATVTYIENGFLNDKLCFQVGYAVNTEYRNQGIAKDALNKSIAEIQHGFRRVIPAFYIEAIVEIDNVASQKVAARSISGTPDQITDSFSGLPALLYTRYLQSGD